MTRVSSTILLLLLLSYVLALTRFGSLGLLEYMHMLAGSAQVSNANRRGGAWRVLLSVLR